MFIFNQFSEISPPEHCNRRNSPLYCVVNMLIQQYITGYMLNSPEHCQNNSHIDDGIINYLTAQKGRWTNNRYNSHLWLSCLERQAVTNFTLQSIYKHDFGWATSCPALFNDRVFQFVIVVCLNIYEWVLDCIVLLLKHFWGTFSHINWVNDYICF